MKKVALYLFPIVPIALTYFAITVSYVQSNSERSIASLERRINSIERKISKSDKPKTKMKRKVLTRVQLRNIMRNPACKMVKVNKQSYIKCSSPSKSSQNI